jgi:two-component system C4-dicarboxylate transport response regulator DctD
MNRGHSVRLSESIIESRNPVPRILLVDDEPTVLDALRLTLEANGFVCCTATDGVEALKVLRQTSVDVVISDLRMPNMSGFELLPNIRCQYPHIGVIVSSSEPEENLRSLQMPIDAYFQKGAYTPEQLVAAIESAMQLHWLQ